MRYGNGTLFARTDQKLIDVYGYSDVLQARLPGLNSRPSHVMRRLPDGYLESIAPMKRVSPTGNSIATTNNCALLLKAKTYLPPGGSQRF